MILSYIAAIMNYTTAENNNNRASQNHLTGIDHLCPEEINEFLNKADKYSKTLKSGNFSSDILSGKIIFNLFFENSTRTRTSFEVAAKRLGAKVINWDAGSSSLSKGESFLDTIKTLNAISPDAIVIRHQEYGSADFTAKRVNCPVINAGDSWREHPTQALLDALTIRQEKGKIEGLNIAICGDIAHSRVANSNIILLTKMGANIRIVAPPALMPEKLPKDSGPVEKFENLEEGINDCDIVMMLRVQKERMESGLISSDREYFNSYGLTFEKLSCARDDALVMHPGPVNRGIEIDSDVADDPVKSLILKQVANGVPVRMAVLDSLICGE
jgi:aspartate carbamoyltransferase catalytic subunit